MIVISCVPEEQCGGLFTIRGSDDNYVCEDTSYTCCHNDVIVQPESADIDGPQQCSKFTSEGYR